MAQYHKGLCHFGEREPSFHVGNCSPKKMQASAYVSASSFFSCGAGYWCSHFMEALDTYLLICLSDFLKI
jgi:hypothetical protein